MTNKRNVRFSNAEEMLEYIQKENDLYSPSTEQYVFVYNDHGSLCWYSRITIEQAKELDKGDEYWGAYLGWYGSEICDTDDYLREVQGVENPENEALISCMSEYMITDWLDVTK